MVVRQEQVFTYWLVLPCRKCPMWGKPGRAKRGGQRTGLHRRLNREMGWTQQRIADVKGCDVPTVSLRVKMHDSLPKVARQATLDGMFDEGHCIAIMGVALDVQTLHPWLTTNQAQTELVAEVLGKHRGSSMGIKPTVKNVRDAASRTSTMPQTIYFEGVLFGTRVERFGTRVETQRETNPGVHGGLVNGPCKQGRCVIAAS